MSRIVIASVLVSAAAAATAATPPILEGEIAALRGQVLGPRAVKDQWQFQIVSMAQDGSRVEAGETVIEFDAGDLRRRLIDAQNKRNEKLSERDKLVLELAERERTEGLRVVEERAKLEKAQRKAAQPAAVLPSVEYRKLVLQREQHERRMGLMERLAERAAEQRRAESALVEAELAQAEEETVMLTSAIAAMRVTAPQAGIVLVRSSWNGQRFEIGSQVWMGQSVADIPEPDSLAVRAVLPERDLLRVRPGQAVRIRLDGGAASALPGRIAEVGRAVRSKSKLQPIPVLDVLVGFDTPPAGLKPGQAVRVEVLP